MSKKYFRKKNPNCSTSEVEWIEMTGQEFFCFVHSPECQGRFFMDLEDYVLECTKEELAEYRAEKDHTEYLREQEEGWSTVSLYTMELEDDCSGEEVIADESQDVESEALLHLNCEELHRALTSLDAEDYAFMRAFYPISGQRATEREMAAKLGLSQVAVHKRKKKIENFLNSWLSNPKKVRNRR